jgi:hypothetical protein
MFSIHSNTIFIVIISDIYIGLMYLVPMREQVYVLMLLPLLLLNSNISVISADNITVIPTETKNRYEDSEEEKIAYVEDIPLLNEKEWNEIEGVVINDERVSNEMTNKQYSLLSKGFVRYLSDDTPSNVKPAQWYANIVYTSKNNNEVYLLSALVDYKEKKVANVSINKYPDIERQHGDFAPQAEPNPAFSVAYYNGTASDIRSFKVRMDTPTSFNGNNMRASDLVAFLLNAVAKFSRDSDLCNPYNNTNSYWAQVGIVWSYRTSVMVWSDSRVGCNIQVDFPRVPYGNVNRYIFIILTTKPNNSTSYNWYLCILNTTARVQECKERNGIAEGTFKTNNINSSVWLENGSTNTNWYTAFGSNISAGNATYMKVNDSTEYKWDSASKVDQDCRGNRSSSIVISGNVINGQWATWNLTTMATRFPACYP